MTVLEYYPIIQIDGLLDAKANALAPRLAQARCKTALLQ